LISHFDSCGATTIRALRSESTDWSGSQVSGTLLSCHRVPRMPLSLFGGTLDGGATVDELTIPI